MNKGRIINGFLKRRIINTPNSHNTRPTSDIVKESIFNILTHRLNIDFENTYVVDMFAGSGSLGIEAISLGAQSAIFIDSDRIAIDCIRSNLTNLGVVNLAKIYMKKAEHISDKTILSFLETAKKVLFFLDPPYKDKQLLFSQINRLKLLLKEKENVTFVIETNEDLNIPNINVIYKKQYGDTHVFFSTP